MGEKEKDLDNSRFKFWYTRKVRSRNRVRIIAYKKWKKDNIDVKREGDKILALKFVVE